MCILVTSCTQDFVKRRNLKKPPSFISIPCFSHHPQSHKKSPAMVPLVPLVLEMLEDHQRLEVCIPSQTLTWKKTDEKTATFVIQNKKNRRLSSVTLAKIQMTSNLLLFAINFLDVSLDELLWSLIVHPSITTKSFKIDVLFFPFSAPRRSDNVGSVGWIEVMVRTEVVRWTELLGMVLSWNAETWRGDNRETWHVNLEKYLRTTTLEGIGWGKNHQKSSGDFFV